MSIGMVAVFYFSSVLLSIILLTIKVEDDGVSLYSGIQVFREATTVGMLMVAFLPVINSVFVIWKIVLYTWLMALNVLIIISYSVRNPPNILTKRPFYKNATLKDNDEELRLTGFYTVRSALIPIHVEVIKYYSLPSNKRGLDYILECILSIVKKLKQELKMNILTLNKI